MSEEFIEPDSERHEYLPSMLIPSAVLNDEEISMNNLHFIMLVENEQAWNDAEPEELRVFAYEARQRLKLLMGQDAQIAADIIEENGFNEVAAALRMIRM